MGDHTGHSKMTVIWWLYRKRSEQSFPPHSEAARMPTNLASQVSGQASLTEDGLARTRAYCAVTPRLCTSHQHLPTQPSGAGTQAHRVALFWPSRTPWTQTFRCPQNRGNFSIIPSDVWA